MDTSKLDEIWKSIRSELEITVNTTQFKAHIPGTHIKMINHEDRIVEITSPSEFQRNFIEDRFYGHLKQITSKVMGKEYRLMFSVTKREPTKLSEKDWGPLFVQEDKESELSALEKAREAGLNERYTMNRFIVGTSNRLAYAVSTAIADNPGKVYNPFFLYSGVGLGKTHLVHAIGHEVLKKHPEMTVLYITGEQFLNEVVEAVRKGGASSQDIKRSTLKKKYRNADVLIIDDVHAIAGKPATQDEFFHTFNALYMSNKQIILTSDRAPHEIKTLEERLSSRFASGMIADIQPPDIETRIAILKERNEELNLGAPDQIIQYIAGSVTSSIRELEAGLLQTITKAKSLGQNLTADSAASILNQISKEKENRITPNSIIKEVAKYYGITAKDIKGQRRLRNLVFPRQIIMYLLREMTGMGYQSIGELLGGRDHSTILHGVAKTQSLLNEKAIFKKELEQIKQNIMIS